MSKIEIDIETLLLIMAESEYNLNNRWSSEATRKSNQLAKSLNVDVFEEAKKRKWLRIN